MRSRGAPWRPARSTPAPAVLSRRPRGGARPPRLCRRFRGFGLRWLHPVGAPLRPSVRLSARLGPLLPVCCSPGPRPGASRFPGVPRPGSVVRFAAARPPTSPRAGRGGGAERPWPSRFPPPALPAAPRTLLRWAPPECGSGPPVCPPRAGRRVLAARRPPPLWGRVDGRRGRVGRPRCGPAGGCGPRPSLPRPSPGRGGARDGGGGWGGGGVGPAALLPSFPPRGGGGGGAPRPSRDEGALCDGGTLAAGGGAGRPVVRSAGRSGFPAPPRPRFLASRVLRLARGVPGHPRHPARSRPARLLVLAPLPG